MNSKRVYRIYAEEKLMVRRRERTRRICAKARVAGAPSENETWTVDFLQDALASGRKVARCRSRMHTRRRCWPSGRHVVAGVTGGTCVGQIPAHRGLPVRIVIDNGTERTSKALD